MSDKLQELQLKIEILEKQNHVLHNGLVLLIDVMGPLQPPATQESMWILMSRINQEMGDS